MPSILLAWELGGGLGHCVNLAPIAEALARRANRVVVAARDVLAARTTILDPEVCVLQAPRLSRPAVDYHAAPRTFAQILHNNGFGNHEALSTLCEAWRAIIKMTAVDAVVAEHAPTALLASRIAGVPSFIVGTGFFSPPDRAPMPDLRPWAGPLPGSVGDVEQNCLAKVNNLLIESGRSPLAYLAQLYSSAAHSFLTTFLELDTYPDRVNGDYCGMWSQEGGSKPTWPVREGPRAFAYLKSQQANVRWRASEVLDALETVGVCTIAYAPGVRWRGRPQSCVKLTPEPVDISSITTECNFAITNGNAGTSTELLRQGTPLLLLPLNLEQLINSRRLADLGAGVLALPNRKDQFTARIDQLVSGQAERTAAQAFADRHQRYEARRHINRIAETIDRFVR